jgi:spermidine synthase
MNSALSRIKLFFFLSGSAGLIYEVVWTRLFADILGSTALSMTVVFSVFLLALAIGAGLFGRISVYGIRALAFYGMLEICVGLSAMLTSIFLIFGKSWIAVHLPRSDFYFVSLFFQFLATAALIGIPTLLMGGTLPVILNAARGWALPQTVVTQLYGLNTLGAACGTFASGFFLIWKLGLTATLAIAISVNILIGLMVLLTARGYKLQNNESLPRTILETPATSPLKERLLWLLLAFLSGFGILSYEILWGRMAKFILGDRTIAITSLLFVFIVCLGLGSILAPILGRRFASTTAQQAITLICWILLAGSFLHLLIVPLARSIILGHGLALPISNEFVRRILTIWLLILPPILVLGFVFPLLVWSARTLNTLPGKVIGNLYFVNTIGAVLGAVIASFTFTRWFGTIEGFLAVTVLTAAIAALILLFGSTGQRQKIAVVLSIGLFLIAGYRFPPDMIYLKNNEKFLKANEDEYGVQVMTLTQNNTIRVRNNKLLLIWDLGSMETSYTQQMAAHLSVLLAEQCGDTINIGTGYGITAGAFTLYNDVQTIETVEILPFLVKNQDVFSRYNFDYLKDSRTHLRQGDGRHYLVTSHKTYDIISVNVLDPYLPGSSSLYTVDFWKVVKNRLRSGGVFTQLFWGADMGLLIKGLHTVFPTVLYFPAYGGTCFNVIAFKDPVTEDKLQLHLERLNPQAKQEIRKITSADDVDLLFQTLVKDAWEMHRKIDEIVPQIPGRLHTDDFPVLEFQWAHGVDNVSVMDSPLAEY